MIAKKRLETKQSQLLVSKITFLLDFRNEKLDDNAYSKDMKLTARIPPLRSLDEL